MDIRTLRAEPTPRTLVDGLERSLATGLVSALGLGLVTGRALVIGLGLAVTAPPAAAAQVRAAEERSPARPAAALPVLAEESGAALRIFASDAELTLPETYRLAELRNPRLAAARALIGASESMEASAALPPDPFIEIGAMNFSLPGFSADMPASMAPSIRAMQMVPFPGKLSLAGRIAQQGTAIRRTDAEAVWWEVRTRAAMAFYEMYAADRALEVMRETLHLLIDFEQVAASMYGAGMGRQADVLRAGVEVARMDAEIRRMEAMRVVAAARLNALLDRPGDSPVPAPRYPTVPASTPPAESLRAWAEASSPMLDGGRVAVERARTREALARRELWPDLSVGVEYGRRNAGAMGVERMGSVMVGFSVPIFAGSRQLRMRDEAEAMERMARADLGEMRAEVDGQIAGLVAELDRTRTLLRLYRSEILPQALANVESAFAAYRVGDVDFMTLVDAQMAANGYEAERYRLLAEYGVALAELEMALGRELPLSSDLITEER